MQTKRLSEDFVASVFHRLIAVRSIVSITKEWQFSAAMLNGDTQLVIIDDWLAGTMDADLAKTFLQGGWMVTRMIRPVRSIHQAELGSGDSDDDTTLVSRKRVGKARPPKRKRPMEEQHPDATSSEE